MISFSDIAPELPKTVPPPVPKKATMVKTDNSTSQNISDKENSYSQIRNTFNGTEKENGLSPEQPHKPREMAHNGKRNPNNWRKDEKSEKSVRDKIAMFSNSDEHVLLPNKFSSHLAKSTECLDSPSLRSNTDTFSRKYSESIENGFNSQTFKSMRTRSHSVDTLDEVDRGCHDNGKTHGNILDMLPPPKPVEKTTYEAAYRSKFMVEKSKPVPMLEKAFSVESLTTTDIIPPPACYGTLPRKSTHDNTLRRTSFSGSHESPDEQRRSSISSLLEQRKKSMSKLRGLVIPEKVPEADILPQSSVIGMPMIKSKECEKINNELIPKMNETKHVPVYARRASIDSYVPSYTKGITNGTGYIDLDSHRRPLGPPPAKPPRMSLQFPTKFSNDYQPKTTDESEDSDSINSSRRSSPLISPGISSLAIEVEKQPLTRTLSSETNISVTSSNSTLTTGSAGSQASCSSVGSANMIDMSRKMSKASSTELLNRKNILALSKSRNGKEEKKLDNYIPSTLSNRYDEDDSTEEEEVKRVPKLRSKNSFNKDVKVEQRDVTNYKLVGPTDKIDIQTINIAQIVEVIDQEDDSFNKSMRKEAVCIKITPKIPEKRSTDEPSPSMSDLAKWVRSEAAKTMPHGIGTLTKRDTNTEAAQKNDKVGEYLKKYTKENLKKVEKTVTPLEEPKKKEPRFGEPKKLNLSEIRKNFENRTNSASPPAKQSFVPIPPAVVITPTPTKEKSGHDRFSSWDSVASSSSGVSSMQTSSLTGNTPANSGSTQNLQSPPSEFGSFSSLGSSHSLITPQVIVF